MFQRKGIAGLILMGGEGRRFGGPTPKQFLLLGGKKIFTYALETFVRLGVFDELLLVCHADWIGEAEGEGVRVVAGGKTRQESTYNGLKALEKRADIVVVHDAVRPFVSERIVLESIEKALVHGAADTCIPSTDTLVHAPDGMIISSIPPRREYFRGQTPQTFQYDLLLQAHEKARLAGVENATDDCSLVMQLGHPVHIVQGDERNFKITSETDFIYAQQLRTIYDNPNSNRQLLHPL